MNDGNDKAPVRVAGSSNEAGHGDWTPWGFWATTAWGSGVLVAFFVLQSVAAIPFVAAAMSENPDIDVVQVLEANAAYLAVAILVAGIGCTSIILLLTGIRRGASIREYLALRWPGTRQLLAWLAIAAVIVVVLDLLTTLLGREVVPEWWLNVYASATSPLLLGFATVFAAPLFEEAFFRGFLFPGLSRSKLGATGTIVVTAALWAAIHTQYGAYEVAQIFILGLVLGLARHRADSLVVPLIIHAAINLGANIQVAFLV